MENDKGQKVLIEAAKILKDHGVDFSIDFIGNGKNEAELKNLTKNYHLENNINFLGFQSRTYVYDNLCHYDLYVQPSIFEGFGLTVSEAKILHKPIVTTNFPSAYDQIIDGETVAEVLDYVQYDAKKLVRQLEVWVAKSVKQNKITLEEGKEFLSNYRSGLYGYTYLE